jgi:outer membrane protein assembly factor BamB
MGPGVQEATPLVRDGVMFLPNPSDYIQAFDAATGDLRWEYKRKLPDDLSKFLPVPSINRNLAIYGNQIIDTSADDFLFALDTATGKLAWETRIVDYRETPAQETSGPIIANGLFDARLRVQVQSGRLHHHGARRQDGQRAVAAADHPEARRAG